MILLQRPYECAFSEDLRDTMSGDNGQRERVAALNKMDVRDIRLRN